LDELVEGNDASFLESIHPAADFEIDVSVGRNLDVVKGINPDFLWNDRQGDADVLEVLHWNAEVIVLFDVDAKVTGAVSGVRDGTIDVDFGVEHGDSW
jgi:hypothetical protein